MFQVLKNAVRGAVDFSAQAPQSNTKKTRAAHSDRFASPVSTRSLLIAGLALSARHALAAPVSRASNGLVPAFSENAALNGHNAVQLHAPRALSPRALVSTAGLTAGEAAQWNAMTQQEVVALQGEGLQSSTIAANYAQAGIKASVASALPPSSPADILNDSLAKAAEEQMAANYPATGSMDLTAAQIATVYGSAISAAEAHTGVPARVMADIIFTESKGHPLTSNGGLGQIDPVAWGQMADANPALKNRYNPADNIMAAAMYLASKAGGNPGSYDAWMAVYHAQYQG